MLSWLDHKFGLTQRNFFSYSAHKRLSKTKFSLLMHKTQEIWHKESLFQQYIFAQSQHQRHRNRCKHSFNTNLPSSSSIYAFKLNNKEIKTSIKMLFLVLCRLVYASMFSWKLLCFDITNIIIHLVNKRRRVTRNFLGQGRFIGIRALP